jgi:xylulokinase
VSQRLVAGIDCSTQSTKALVVDVDDGTVVATGKAEHEVTGTGGARETHPEVWWQALKTALEATGRAGEVSAISVAGQQHGLVVLGDDGPLRPSMLWNDIRSAPEALELIDALGGPEVWAETVGVVPVASFTATKWAWLRRHEPAVAAATKAIRLPHDYLTERLSGHGATDRGDASGSAWWSTKTGDYVDEVLQLDAIGLDRALLPDVLGPGDAAGETGDAAAELGLPRGIPVGPGTGDNMGAAVGLGLEPGVPVISLGTSGTAYAVSERRVVDPSGTVAGFADATGRFLPLAATLNCTLAVDRVAAWLGLDRGDAAERTDVVMLPFLDGERTPNLPEAAGTIAGLRHATTPQEILLAAYEGAAASLLAALDVIDRNSSGLDPAAPLVLIGGGAKGPVWQRVAQRFSGRAVSVPATAELVAMGGAAQAAAILTGESPEAVARRWQTRSGLLLDPADVDAFVLERIDQVRRLAEDLNAWSGWTET